MASEEFSLVLGCGGYVYSNICLCAGTHNVIVDFNHHFEALQLKALMDFLDFACGLFDSPIGDWNKIINTLKMLHDRFGLVDDKTWEALHMWLPQHKRCGAFLRLMFNADIDSTFQQSEEAHIGPSFMECPVAPEIEAPVLVPIQPRTKKMSKKRNTKRAKNSKSS